MHELLTPAESGLADQYALEHGRTFDQLVHAAGRAVATAAIQFSPVSILVLSGPGNNGADGRVAADLLERHGLHVEHLTVGDSASIDEAIDAVTPFGSRAGRRLIIDALVGAGLNRPIEGPLANLVEAINASSAHVLAVDIPSGIDGASGQVSGVSVLADRTVTFFRKKPGHLLLPGRQHCGPVTVVDIGIGVDALGPIAPQLWEGHPDLWVLPRRRAADHKYSAGHCVVVSGGRWQTGASRLSAWAALGVGAGAVTLAGAPDALDVHAAHVTAVMLRPASTGDDIATMLEQTRAQVAVIGPGLGVGQHPRELCDSVVAGDAAIVLDADALTCSATDPDKLFGQLRSRRAATVLTPHHAEFLRLFPDLDDSNKVDAARRAAARSGAVVIFKGADTVIASPDGRAVINSNAPPTLATAGSGDVLAGMVAGFLAQGMPTFEAAAAAVYEHGAAAARGPQRLTAISLLDSLRQP